jgi:hypothetical protein
VRTGLGRRTTQLDRFIAQARDRDFQRDQPAASVAAAESRSSA